MKPDILRDRRARAEKANELIRAIASCGRMFFRHVHNDETSVSRFDVDARGMVWWWDGWHRKPFYTHTPEWRRWKWWHEGGTLLNLVKDLREYVIKATPFPARHHFGPWPEWICGGDLWGYGEDMAKLREAAQKLEMLDKEAA